jgi:circadian clock protein KaiC
LVGTQFLVAGAQQGEPGLYFGMFEPPAHLIAKAEHIGMHLQDQVQQGLLELIWQSPHEDILDVYAERVLVAVQRRAVRRLFFDGLDGLRHVVYAERLPQFFTALLHELSVLGVTTIFSADMNRIVSPELELPLPRSLTTQLDTIILLRPVDVHGQLARMISILKGPARARDVVMRQVTVSDQGIDIADLV